LKKAIEEKEGLAALEFEIVFIKSKLLSYNKNKKMEK